MRTSADIFPKGDRRGEKRDIRLSEAWQAILEGRGSKEDAELAFSDLAEFSGYYFVPPAGTSGDDLQRDAGRRETFARILYLLDVPMTRLTEMRLAALGELQVTNEEGER